MTRHLAKCAANHHVPGPPVPVTDLRIEGAGDPRYWLYVEVRSGATLQRLDAFLRRVWLECCGHMSAFRLGQRELPMRTSIGTLNSPGVQFDYEYDFGSTTALRGRVLGTRQGTPGRAAVRLVARNDALTWRCDRCGEPATVVCPFCLYSEPALFCDTHAPEHPCAVEEAWLPVVNSPRMGVCGYTG
jgi:hypothetical protein